MESVNNNEDDQLFVDSLNRTFDTLKDVQKEIKDLTVTNTVQKQTNNRLRKMLIALTVSLLLDITLTVGIAVLGNNAYNQAHSATHLSESIAAARMISCTNENQSRIGQKNLWDYIITASQNSPAQVNQTPEEKAKEIQEIAVLREIINKDFQPLNCTLK